MEGDHTSWKEKLGAVRFAMNTARCQSTGFFPVYLTFGRNLRTPGDVNRDMRAITNNDVFIPQITPYLRRLACTLQDARDNQEKAQDRAKKYADERRQDLPKLQVDGNVFINKHALSKAKDSYTSKFAPRRDGPYEVCKITSPTTYEISPAGQPDQPVAKCHRSALRPYKGKEGCPTPVHPLRKRGRPRKVTKPDTKQPPPADSPHENPPPAEPLRADGREQRHVKKPSCPCCLVELSWSPYEDAYGLQRGRM